MPLPSAERRIYRFGAFEVDVHAGEVRKQGIRIRVQDQPLKLLIALLERPGELITREELHRRLWPGETFVDFEHGLNAAVTRLRQALGDSAQTPRFIESLPRRGYRFVGAVKPDMTDWPAELAAGASSPLGPGQQPLAMPGKGGKPLLAWIAAAVFLLAAVVVSTVHFGTRSKQELPPFRFALQPPQARNSPSSIPLRHLRMVVFWLSPLRMLLGKRSFGCAR